jgi:hypothetical protein
MSTSQPGRLDANWLRDFAACTRAAVLDDGRWDPMSSCIVTARIGVEVARYFGLAARPLPVTVRVWNDHYSVGTLGTGKAEGNRWDGHLALVLGNVWLVDPSADLFDRPAHGLVVGGPVVLPLVGRGGQQGGWCRVAELPGGARVAYRRLVGRECVWRRSPDWSNRRAALKPVMGAAIRDLTRRT